MKVSLQTKKQLLRRAFLDQEEKAFLGSDDHGFKKIKDCDHQSLNIVWEGQIRDTSLNRPYKIRIVYGCNYPFAPPEVYPIEPVILNQRHQIPTHQKSKEPGHICLFAVNPDYWKVGIRCDEILRRIINWLQRYEAGTLDEEFAPPEIERHFPTENCLSQPFVILAESALKVDGAITDECLLIPTESGKYAFIAAMTGEYKEQDRLKEISRLHALLLSGDPLDGSKRQKGIWFHVDSEPRVPVPANVSALAEFIARHAVKAGRKSGGMPIKEVVESIKSISPGIVAIWYETEHCKSHWLVFQTNKVSTPSSNGGFREHMLYKKVLIENRGNETKIFSTHHLDRETIFKRVSGYAVESLLQKTCVILGCGTLGSKVAEILVKTGVGRIVLVDNDIMRVGNVCRHVLGLDSLGEPKVLALREALLRKNPFAEIQFHYFNIIDKPDLIDRLISDSDLVISCLARDSIESMINLSVLAWNKPALYCRTYLQGRIGEIILCNGTEETCFNCHLDIADDSVLPRIPDLPLERIVGLDADCGSAFIPASAVDMDLISLHSARMALALLEGKSYDSNHWFIRGREFEKSEYPDLDSRLLKPFQILDYTLSKSENCFACSIVG